MPDKVIFQDRELQEITDFNRLGELTLNKLDEFIYKYLPFAFRVAGNTFADNIDTTNKEKKYPLVLSGLAFRDYLDNDGTFKLFIKFSGIGLGTNNRIIKGLNNTTGTDNITIDFTNNIIGNYYLYYIYLIESNITENRYFIDPSSPSTPPVLQSTTTGKDIKWGAGVKNLGTNSDFVNYFLDDNNFPGQLYRIPVCVLRNTSSTIYEVVADLIPSLYKENILAEPQDEFLATNNSDRDNSIYKVLISSRKFFKALLENIREIKGTSKWYHKPVSKLNELLRKDSFAVDHDSTTSMHFRNNSLSTIYKGYISNLRIFSIPKRNSNDIAQIIISAGATIEINGKLRKILTDKTTPYSSAGGQIVYIYADASNDTSDFDVVLDTTVPVWYDIKCGWYDSNNANRRCIGSYSPGTPYGKSFVDVPLFKQIDNKVVMIHPYEIDISFSRHTGSGTTELVYNLDDDYYVPVLVDICKFRCDFHIVFNPFTQQSTSTGHFFIRSKYFSGFTGNWDVFDYEFDKIDDRRFIFDIEVPVDYSLKEITVGVTSYGNMDWDVNTTMNIIGWDLKL